MGLQWRDGFCGVQLQSHRRGIEIFALALSLHPDLSKLRDIQKKSLLLQSLVFVCSLSYVESFLQLSNSPAQDDAFHLQDSLLLWKERPQMLPN